jgi:hypothetical protein
MIADGEYICALVLLGAGLPRAPRPEASDALLSFVSCSALCIHTKDVHVYTSGIPIDRNQMFCRPEDDGRIKN